MPLTTTPDLMSALQAEGASDRAIVARFDLLRQGVEAAVKSYVKWGIEQEEVTEFHDGLGYRDIVLRRPFASSVANVWLDQTGAYGDGLNAFAAATLLTAGTDYALVRDGRSSLVRKLRGTSYWFPSDLVFGQSTSALSHARGTFWPAGYGNVKVQYTFGFSVIPDDIKLAVWTAAGIITNSVRYGWPVQSESLADYSYSLAISREFEFGTVRQLLSPYRDTAI